MDADLSPAQQRIALLWLALESFPLQLQAACAGKSVQSVLNGLTGLSPAHLSTRGLAVTNPKKLRQVQQHGQQWLLTFLTDKGYSSGWVKALISGQPQTPLAALAYGIQHSAFQPLPLTVGHAQRLDAFTAGAMGRLMAQDLPSYRAWLLAFLQEASDAGAAADPSEPLGKLAKAIAAADDWYAMRWPTDQLAQQVLLSFVAAWDVESGAHYFSALVPMPTLPGFFPRIQAAKNNPAPEKAKKLAVIRPVQLLLQKLWVVSGSFRVMAASALTWQIATSPLCWNGSLVLCQSCSNLTGGEPGWVRPRQGGNVPCA